MRMPAWYGCPVLPLPSQPLPRTPSAIVQALARDEAQLAPALARWGGNGPPPRDVSLLALYRQRLVRTAPLEVARLRPAERDDVLARRDLLTLAAQSPPLRARIRLGPAAPARSLLAWYRQAQARFRIRWQLLAAVNFVESAFGKVRNTSTAGAQGPMQFEPATWRAYGLGGDVHDPHDAILGAANYLAANRGAHDERDALYHYNPSPLYVDAVVHLAHRIATVPTAFLEYYSWQVYVNGKRVTGPR